MNHHDIINQTTEHTLTKYIRRLILMKWKIDTMHSSYFHFHNREGTSPPHTQRQ